MVPTGPTSTYFLIEVPTARSVEEQPYGHTLGFLVRQVAVGIPENALSFLEPVLLRLRANAHNAPHRRFFARHVP